MSIDRLRELRRRADAARACDDRAWARYRADPNEKTLRCACLWRQQRQHARRLYDEATQQFIDEVME